MRAARILVTGGAGFIGGHVVRRLLADPERQVLNLDALTYAANPVGLTAWAGDPRYAFEKVDITDDRAVAASFARFQPDAVIHLAAETHVDRSIEGPGAFVDTNMRGTFVLLEAARRFSSALPGVAREAFRFIHVSTDEVFGSLGSTGAFDEATPYDPRSPYSASKAASDHLARAWFHTYGLPVVVANCSNNYGPWQFPEKLIPLVIAKARRGEPLPVYGDGLQVRDWLHVEDHAEALVRLLEAARPGEGYCIGGAAERTNLEVVQAICDGVDALAGALSEGPRRSLITLVEDRPGHDRRYAMNFAKIERELGWRPQRSFEQGLADTVRWYLQNDAWLRSIEATRYAGQRLGRTPGG